MSSTHLPPVVIPAVDPKTGLPTVQERTWRQLLLQARSAWTTYTPTVANLSALTVNDCAFCQLGKMIAVRIALKGTSNGGFFSVSLPFPIKGTAQAFAATLTVTGTQFAASASAASANPSTIFAQKYDGSTPANLEVDDWRIQGVYEAQ